MNDKVKNGGKARSDGTFQISRVHNLALYSLCFDSAAIFSVVTVE